MTSAYQNRKVLITGGLGFIGSNVAVRLASLGARVTVVDSCEPGCGANRHNLSEIEDAARVITADVGDSSSVAAAVGESDCIFNLAGEISHIHSMWYPERDAALNAGSQLRFLEICARERPGVRVVYAGTRQVYGVPEYLPVDEGHPVRPVDFNGIHKYAATAYHLLWSAMEKIDGRVLCLTNIYGPRMALNAPCQGFLGTFLRKTLQGRQLEIFGDGRQLRDPVYVDDAVDAFLLAGAAEAPRSRLWNVGGSEVLALASIACAMSRAVGTPEPLFRPFPADRKPIDIGSYSTDSSRIREELGWEARVGFEEGLRRSLEYFRGRLEHYLPGGEAAPNCELESQAAATV